MPKSESLDLYIVRHGIALDRELARARGVKDRDRPLTEKGRHRTREVAKALTRRAPEIEAIWSSPLVRAVETAAIVAKPLGLDYATTATLIPNAAPEALLELLAQDAPGRALAVVGHEPHLGRLIAWSLVGEARSFALMRKAGVCLLRFTSPPRAGAGQLVWFLPPALLRKL
jgi:phosphohistidine phosphatase